MTDDDLYPLRWYTLGNGLTVGFVGLVDLTVGYFKVYVGVCTGNDLRADTESIGRRGTPVMDEALARVLVGKHHAFQGLRYEF